MCLLLHRRPAGSTEATRVRLFCTIIIVVGDEEEEEEDVGRMERLIPTGDDDATPHTTPHDETDMVARRMSALSSYSQQAPGATLAFPFLSRE